MLGIIRKRSIRRSNGVFLRRNKYLKSRFSFLVSSQLVNLIARPNSLFDWLGRLENEVYKNTSWRICLDSI